MQVTAELDQRFYRIVIGCYSHRESHLSAMEELRHHGLQDRQICSLVSRSALGEGSEAEPVPALAGGLRTASVQYHLRKIRELEFHVTSLPLFDRLWPAPHHHDGSLARWMTPTQSDVIWRILCEDCPILMVSADSAQQQVQSSQIQLRHRPTVVQAFNFAV